MGQQMIIYNNLIPVKGFSAMNLFGIIFARKAFKPLPKYIINHEQIHTKQIVELAFIFFYVIYGIEWLIRLIQYKSSKLAYYNISFEKEAYDNQYNNNYKRKHYAQWRKKV